LILALPSGVGMEVAALAALIEFDAVDIDPFCRRISR
jgi:hypothetical protein